MVLDLGMETLLVTNQGLMSLKDIYFNTNAVNTPKGMLIVKEIFHQKLRIVSIRKVLGPIRVLELASGKKIETNNLSVIDKYKLSRIQIDFGGVEEDVEVSKKIGEILSKGYTSEFRKRDFNFKRDVTEEKAQALLIEYWDKGIEIYKLFDRQSMSKFLEGYLRIIRNGRVMTTNPEVLLEILQSYCLDAYMRDGKISLEDDEYTYLNNLLEFKSTEIRDKWDYLISSRIEVKEHYEVVFQGEGTLNIKGIDLDLIGD